MRTMDFCAEATPVRKGGSAKYTTKTVKGTGDYEGRSYRLRRVEYETEVPAGLELREKDDWELLYDPVRLSPLWLPLSLSRLRDLTRGLRRRSILASTRARPRARSSSSSYLTAPL